MQFQKRPDRRFTGGLLFAALALTPAAEAQQADAPPVEQWLTTVNRDLLPDLPFGLGMIPTDDAGYARSPHLQFGAVAREALPSHVLLTRFLPPIAQQGKQGSCVGWSLAYYTYTYMVGKNRRFDQKNLQNPRFEFSPAYIYHQGNKGKDGGMAIETGCQILANAGCSSLLEMPYDAKDYTSPPGESAVKRAANYKAPAFGCLFAHMGTAKPQDLKTWLAETETPFVMGIPIFKDFPMRPVDPDTVYDLSLAPTKENVLGGHAICCVGYDSDKRAFRLVNSWGPVWGDKGFLWVSEDFVQKYAMCGFAFVAGGPIARGAGKVGPHITMIPAKKPASKLFSRDMVRPRKAKK